ncbi:hypothetical protein F8M41_003597 [Gigaspora margarita]|uniref:Uncharacterized protein n=1 Tax=Gigaspora margarita TaxID=4874 RepID=A0A8H4A6G0_GIGMA|nr:hypothetical protein F8M41_003597 [Gigaspora margarita]
MPSRKINIGSRFTLKIVLFLLRNIRKTSDYARKNVIVDICPPSKLYLLVLLVFPILLTDYSYNKTNDKYHERGLTCFTLKTILFLSCDIRKASDYARKNINVDICLPSKLYLSVLLVFLIFT